jgi:hypothetical protein
MTFICTEVRTSSTGEGTVDSLYGVNKKPDAYCIRLVLIVPRFTVAVRFDLISLGTCQADSGVEHDDLAFTIQ